MYRKWKILDIFKSSFWLVVALRLNIPYRIQDDIWLNMQNFCLFQKWPLIHGCNQTIILSVLLLSRIKHFDCENPYLRNLGRETLFTAINTAIVLYCVYYYTLISVRNYIRLWKVWFQFWWKVFRASDIPRNYPHFQWNLLI